ncbi:hypothetical protein Bbelb_350060 [Branchiostoma belcheri]|nr:hypothetical protein Bbelb_350060 [Branchiostoma belcheri]
MDIGGISRRTTAPRFSWRGRAVACATPEMNIKHRGSAKSEYNIIGDTECRDTTQNRHVTHTSGTRPAECPGKPLSGSRLGHRSKVRRPRQEVYAKSLRVPRTSDSAEAVLLRCFLQHGANDNKPGLRTKTEKK